MASISIYGTDPVKNAKIWKAWGKIILATDLFPLYSWAAKHFQEN
jgi:hypothetical protein